jgi:hypothetical protein
MLQEAVMLLGFEPTADNNSGVVFILGRSRAAPRVLGLAKYPNPNPTPPQQVLVFIAFIIACVSASNMSKQPTGKAAGFAGVWTVLLLVLISGLGQWTMRKGLTQLSIGFFLGVLFIMVQQMLILFAIFVDRSKIPGQSDSVVSSQQAMATFSFFLFLVYTVFGTLLAVFREDVLKKDDGMDGELEPAYEDTEEQQVDNTM